MEVSIEEPEEMSIEILKGKIIEKIYAKFNEEIIFQINDSEIYKMYHSQDCCEQVCIDDICGDLNDLIDCKILDASEETNRDEKEGDDSGTWTFYKLSTIKGYVTIKWYGSSNGYYSESVHFIRVYDMNKIDESLSYFAPKINLNDYTLVQNNGDIL